MANKPRRRIDLTPAYVPEPQTGRKSKRANVIAIMRAIAAETEAADVDLAANVDLTHAAARGSTRTQRCVGCGYPTQQALGSMAYLPPFGDIEFYCGCCIKGLGLRKAPGRNGR